MTSSFLPPIPRDSYTRSKTQPWGFAKTRQRGVVCAGGQCNSVRTSLSDMTHSKQDGQQNLRKYRINNKRNTRDDRVCHPSFLQRDTFHYFAKQFLHFPRFGLNSGYNTWMDILLTTSLEVPFTLRFTFALVCVCGRGDQKAEASNTVPDRKTLEKHDSSPKG